MIANLGNERTELIRLLESAGAVFHGNDCRCPFHDDRHASAGVFQGDDGRWRFRCHACGVKGDLHDLKARLENRPLGDVLREARGDDDKPRATAKAAPTFKDLGALTAGLPGKVTLYEYPKGLVVVRVDRPDGKTFRQAHAVPGGFVWGGVPKPWPPFHADRLATADTVFVCEGEKSVEAAERLGLAATTGPGGAGKAASVDWSPLAGKRVVLWPDADDPGHKHMQDVAAILETLQPTVKLYAADPVALGLEHKQDAWDFVEQNGTGPDAVAMIRAATRPLGPSAGLRDLLEATIAGRRTCIGTPWPMADRLTRALQPGAVMLLCGSPGASKSLTLLQACQHWQTTGTTWAAYELEESRDYHLLRVLAQRSGLSDLTDPGWVKDHPDEVRAAFDEHADFLDAFGKCLWARSDNLPTLADVADWIEQRASEGVRVIAVDPITQADRGGENPWTADNAFLGRAKRSAEQHGASIVLVTHPVKAWSGPDLNNLAGSAAFGRFSQTALWLESHDAKTSAVATACGTTDLQHNRTLHVLKARYGQGQGVRLACTFRGEDLTLRELGSIVR